MEFLTPPFVLAMLLALTVHECAHGFVASLLGDTTAKREGRLTLNPLAHLDLLGTLLFLTVGFGWAKPVPIDPRAFRNEKRDTMLTALAGPLSNFLLAFAVVLLAKLALLLPITPGEGTQFLLVRFFQDSLFLNLGLGAFNLLPIAPLDGSKILAFLIPWQYEDAYERYLQQGPMLLLILLLAERLLNLPLIVTWIRWIISPMFRLLELIM